MKQPRTLDLLYDLIDKDYAWRIQELSTFRNSVRSEVNIIAKTAKLRVGVALLYAHWEGFIKALANLYYQHVSSQKLKVGDLNYCFLAIYAKDQLQAIGESKRLVIYTKMMEEVFQSFDQIAKLPALSPIKTSNLNYAVFEDVCILLGLQISDFETRYLSRFQDNNLKLTIDNDLVDHRNRIAHGNYLLIGEKKFLNLHDVVVNGLLYNFKEVVMDSAVKRLYLR